MGNRGRKRKGSHGGKLWALAKLVQKKGEGKNKVLTTQFGKQARGNVPGGAEAWRWGKTEKANEEGFTEKAGGADNTKNKGVKGGRGLQR